MAVEVFVNYNGNCREAVEYYTEVFGAARPEIMTFGDSPSQPVPEETKDLVLYTRLVISGSTVMFSDTFPGMHCLRGNNISLTVSNKNMDKIKTWFEKMKEGSEVTMELQETFFSKCYGSLVDKFGIPWQFSHDGND